MNLVLIGYRGTGKSEVSAELARRLDRRRVGMDETLVERFGQRIPEFVEAHGWDAFRDAESELVQELASQDNLVIDCGGGVIVRDQNIDRLRSTGQVFWLKATPETITRRIAGDTERPSLTGTKTFLEEIEEVLNQRLPLYSKASHFTLDTDTLTVEEVADRVLDLWKSDRG
jgi:shikimate kinase